MAEKRRLPTFQPDESLCKSCNGACCQAGAILELSDEERDFLIAGGTELARTKKKTRGEREAELKALFGPLLTENTYLCVEGPNNPTYIMKTDCGYLQRRVGQMAICTVYSDRRIPAICPKFEPGSQYCLDFRRERGVDPK